MIDSNIAIYILSDRVSSAALRLSTMRSGEAVASSIAYAEVMRGIPERETAARASARRLFSVVPVLDFGAVAGDSYARLPFKRARFDRLIAAHALALDLTLVTNNTRDFADVPGLRVENWTA